MSILWFQPRQPEDVAPPDPRLFELQLALSQAWDDIDREIWKPVGVGQVAAAVERWSGLYRQWCALTRERAYWGA